MIICEVVDNHNGGTDREEFEDLDSVKADLAETADPDYTAKVLAGLAAGGQVTVMNGEYTTDTWYHAG